MIYFDAAYVAKCYLNEPGTDRVRDRHMLQAAKHFYVTGVNVLSENG